MSEQVTLLPVLLVQAVLIFYLWILLRSRW
jgi:hypothetical protein